MKTQFILLAGALLIACTYATYSQITGMKSLYYSAAAYCSGNILESWECGEACKMEKGITNVTLV